MKFGAGSSLQMIYRFLLGAEEPDVFIAKNEGFIIQTQII
jgi:hypothetical protein